MALNLLLARWQFGVTTVFHFFFVPVTIGLSLLIAVLETIYVRRGDEAYRRLAEFFGRLFLVNFALGVVTGILQEFQFGMNWSSYSRFVGDVFGAPLAVEALLAFFLESTFLGVWIFGWDRVSKSLHAASMWLVALGTLISAFWILTANSFMQEPVGYALRGGRAEMTDFLALLGNPQLWVEFPHTVFGAYATAGFFMAGISAYQILRRHHPDLFARSLRLGVLFAAVFSLLVVVMGHAQAVHLVSAQPMKMAASEALWQTSPSPAPWTLVAIPDSANQRNYLEIQIPYALSLLAYGRLSGSVPGIEQLQAQAVARYGPGDYVPPVGATFWSFRLMVLAGTLMLLLGLYGAVLLWRGRDLAARERYLRLLVWAIALPYVANATGWLMTEIGRQPWVVTGLLKTADAVSPTVSALDVGLSLALFTLLYSLMAAADLHLTLKYVRLGLEGRESEEVPEVGVESTLGL
ncbi:MAG: cytochrome ubiquinol oxidase subunit I [Clostridia bacterium]|nr:cytochrome ubiquinol oxidase subunit I [Clostridia bacterium]